MNAPKAKKLGGISLSLHLKQGLDELVSLHSDAYKLMGSTTRETYSDQLDTAVELLLKKFTEEHGPLPSGPGRERIEYVKRLADSLGREMRSDLNPSSKSA